MLRDFIQRYNIDEKAIERIKHRLFVVGRFNQSSRKKDPEVFLFTNRPESQLPESYRDGSLFTDRRPMIYERFVELLRPSLSERVTYEEHVPPEAQIPRIRQMVPRDNEDAREGTVTVDVFHYLFQRAISSTKQAPLKSIRPRLPIELESLGHQHAGKGIFKLIRKSLNIFAEFQPKTHLIVDGMSRLLDACAKENGMPPYAHGDPLPGGFPEKLIDFVYAEDSSAPFDMSGLDLKTPPWSNLVRNEGARRMFQNVVVAFRDALLGLNREQFGTVWFQGRTLNEQANALFSGAEDADGSKERKDLADSFNRARDAFNTLRQVLRSKALISMILDWLIESYYDLPQVPKDKVQAQKDRAVAELILKGADNVARPIIRPSKTERDRFSESLAANFEKILKVLYEKGDAFETKLAEDLGDAPELQRLARTLRSNKRLLETLGRVAAPAGGIDTRQAFIDASKTVLLDVLCPVLFEQPILTEDDLRMFFRQETSSAYLTAIFLAKSNKDQVALIGRKNIEYFKKKIDEKTKEIRDTGEIQEKFLGEFIDILASEEIQRQMEEGLRVLREAQTILANMPKGAGAGSISAVRPDPAIGEEDYTLTQTAVKPAEVELSLRKLVDKLVVSDKRIIEVIKIQPGVTAAAAAASGSPGNAGSGSGKSGDAVTDSAVPAEPPAEAPGRGLLGDSRIAAEAGAKVDSVLTMFFKDRPAEAGAAENASPVDVKELSAQASEALLKDESFMNGVRKDIESYEQVLYLIYQRYVENSGSNMADFTNSVDRLTLINMMSLFQDELGLGTVSSNLHYLLIDMVKHLDRDNPDPAEFIRKVSLTRYFDDAKLGKIGGGYGITNVRETLRAQAYENLKETQSFASELWGIRYLMEQVKADRDAEIIVVNATADEFMSWLKNDNLTQQRGSGRFRSEKLVTRDNRSAECVQPGLIYFTDSAFPASEGGVDQKNNFLQGLSQASLSNGALRMLLPPICLSTRVYEGDQWKREAENWAKTAAGVPAPVIIVGPSAFLNDPDDYFKTYLPAGYMFASHFLSRAGQSIRIDNVNTSSNGRLRVIGGGADYMHKTLDRVFWPSGQGDAYGFAVDYYLYLVLTLLTAAYGDANPPNSEAVRQYYSDFYRPMVAQGAWRGSGECATAFLAEGQGVCFSLACTPPVQTQDGRSQAGPPVPITPGEFTDPLVFLERNGLSGDGPFSSVKEIAWFNSARQKANLQ